MEKKEIRNFVHTTVENFFYGEITKSQLGNITLTWDRLGGTMDATVYVQKPVYGKLQYIGVFDIPRYYNNDWEMVSQPWVCDLITDITNCVTEHLEIGREKPVIKFVMDDKEIDRLLELLEEMKKKNITL